MLGLTAWSVKAKHRLRCVEGHRCKYGEGVDCADEQFCGSKAYSSFDDLMDMSVGLCWTCGGELEVRSCVALHRSIYVHDLNIHFLRRVADFPASKVRFCLP